MAHEDILDVVVLAALPCLHASSKARRGWLSGHGASAFRSTLCGPYNHADRLGQRARTRRGDHSSIVIITIKTEGSACANPSVDDDATGSG